MLPGWDAQAERYARELLYRCLEELGATKAALYLEGDSGSFELATSYGFGKRDTLTAELKPGTPLLDWVRRHRTTPAFNNQASADPGLGPILSGAGTGKLMTVPLTLGDRLVGLIDARDKGRKQPYAAEDVPVARTIGGAIEQMLRELGLYPGEPATGSAPAAPPLSAAQPSPPTAGRPPAPAASASLHSSVITAAASMLRTLSGVPSVGGLALTVTDGRTVRCLLLHSAALDPERREAVATHQAQALAAAGVRLPPANRWGWEEQPSGGTERVADAIHTAVLGDGPPVWVLASVLTPPGSNAGERILAAARSHFQQAAALRAYRRSARNLARILLEPGEASLVHLRTHSQAVSELTQRIAGTLGLSDEDEELVTLAGWLHDVGMRELDYSRMYRMDRPGEAERRIFQRHPTVGARIVEGAEFPTDLTAAIRHHHERWDGTGYPHRLAGNAIPLASRIVHVAEVWDTLTSQSSYKRPIGREAALDVMQSESGRQFDRDLVKALEEIVRP